MGDNEIAIGIPSIATPFTGSKTPRLSARSSSFDFSSSTSVYTFSRRMSGSNNLYPRSLLPYSEDTDDRVPLSWNETLFRRGLSENALSALQSLQGSFLSPSSSSVSLDEMSQQRESLDINTDSIFLI
jgi:hypothetical protein